jgi:hypothetical protein
MHRAAVLRKLADQLIELQRLQERVRLAELAARTAANANKDDEHDASTAGLEDRRGVSYILGAH